MGEGRTGSEAHQKTKQKLKGEAQKKKINLLGEAQKRGKNS